MVWPFTSPTADEEFSSVKPHSFRDSVSINPKNLGSEASYDRTKLPIQKEDEGNFFNQFANSHPKGFGRIRKMLSDAEDRQTDEHSYADKLAQYNEGQGMSFGDSESFDPSAEAGENGIETTWLGHATFLLKYGNFSIMTDPCFSRASPFSFAGPARLWKEHKSLKTFSPNVVLLSHTHYDHMNLRDLANMNTDTPVIVPQGASHHLVGIGMKKVVELAWWQSVTVAPNVTVTAVPAMHWSSRTLFDDMKEGWCGFVMTVWPHDSPLDSAAALPTSNCTVSSTRPSRPVSVYFSGDTGYDAAVFRPIREVFDIDVSYLPIGAYTPRWFMGTLHMHPQESVRAHAELKSKRSFGMHWGTFKMTGEDETHPPAVLKEAMQQWKTGFLPPPALMYPSFTSPKPINISTKGLFPPNHLPGEILTSPTDPEKTLSRVSLHFNRVAHYDSIPSHETTEPPAKKKCQRDQPSVKDWAQHLEEFPLSVHWSNIVDKEESDPSAEMHKESSSFEHIAANHPIFVKFEDLKA